MLAELKSKLLGDSYDLTKLEPHQELPWYHEFRSIIDLDANIPNIVKQAKKSNWLNAKIKVRGKLDYDREILIGPVQMNTKLE